MCGSHQILHYIIFKEIKHSIGSGSEVILVAVPVSAKPFTTFFLVLVQSFWSITKNFIPNLRSSKTCSRHISLENVHASKALMDFPLDTTNLFSPTHHPLMRLGTPCSMDAQFKKKLIVFCPIEPKKVSPSILTLLKIYRGCVIHRKKGYLFISWNS